MRGISGTNALILYCVGTVITVVVVTFASVMMAFGTGLASTPENPVPTVSTVLWSISGLSFIPCFVVLLLAAATRQRVWGVVLGLLVIAAGMITGIGWVISGDGHLPGTTGGDRIVLASVLIPLLIGTMIIWLADALESSR